MTEDEKRTETIYIRVPPSLKYALEDMARDRSRRSGERVSMTDLLIEAAEQYIQREQLEAHGGHQSQGEQ